MAATVLIVCVASMLALSLWILWHSRNTPRVEHVADRFECPNCGTVSLHAPGSSAYRCPSCGHLGDGR